LYKREQETMGDKHVVVAILGKKQKKKKKICLFKSMIPHVLPKLRWD